MNGDHQVLHTPQEGEGLAQYLQRITDAELQQLGKNPELLISFSEILQECFRDFVHTEDCLENLWNVIHDLNDFDNLRYCIRCLEPVRRSLLELLASKENELNQISKLCTIGRIVGSSLDIAGTIGGLWLKSSKSGYANLAFRTATSFGLLGLVSTTSEMSILKNSLDEMMKLIKKDQELFAPIQRWYRQTNELEEAMKAVFPFQVTSQIVTEFADMGNNQFNPARLLAVLLRSIAEHDLNRIRDETLIRNLISFTLYPASQDWCEWIIFRRHPVILDITRMILQFQSSPFRFTLCQSIPALSIADQSIKSFPVWGRIGLNLVSLADAINSLRKSELSAVASEIKHLREHMRSELTSLQRIVEFVELRRRQLRRLS